MSTPLEQALRRRCDPGRLRKRALEGDRTLVSDVFACYREDMLGFLRHRCGNPDDAQDAAQDAFEAAVRYLDGYRGEAPLKTWLYRLAGSACTKMRRGRKNDPRLHAELDEGRPGSLDAFGAQVEAGLEARLGPLRAALEDLGDADRAVLLARDGLGMTTAEVATAIGVSEAAVKSRLHRARKATRGRLASDPPPG